MQTAKVKWWNANKGFGFLVPATGGNDVFVHISALEKSGIKTLRDGQTVQYELEPDRQNRMCATNLRVVA